MPNAVMRLGRFAAVLGPARRHVEQFGIMLAKIRLDLGHAGIGSEIVEFPRDPLPGQFRHAWQHAHRLPVLLPKRPVGMLEK